MLQRVRVRLVLLVALVLALSAASCAGDEDRGTLTIETRTGPVELSVELADTDDERRRGLMGRESLPADEGMVFLFEREHQGGLWMKDTLVPLSAAFLDRDGRVLSIVEMTPCESDPCPVYDPGITYVAAVEVNRGTFERLGVAVGDIARLER
jgi:uncharacterized membrane protein (UPF0127 family)